MADLKRASNGNPSLQTIRIAIADQQPIFRHGLRRLLETDPRLIIVSETDDGATAAEAIRELRPDILLLGLNASRYRAVDTLREVAANGGEVRTIILADRLGAPEVASALQLGACGVLPKDSAPDELFDCIHAVMAGHMWVGRAPTSTMGASLKKLKATRRQMKAFGHNSKTRSSKRHGWQQREVLQSGQSSEHGEIASVHFQDGVSPPSCSVRAHHRLGLIESRRRGRAVGTFGITSDFHSASTRFSDQPSSARRLWSWMTRVCHRRSSPSGDVTLDKRRSNDVFCNTEF